MHRAEAVSALEAPGLAADRGGRACLNAVIPTLRAKRVGEAVGIFVGRDAVAPAALTRLMSNRAARRFSDRWWLWGAVRELTGRETFRLYGL